MFVGWCVYHEKGLRSENMYVKLAKKVSCSDMGIYLEKKKK
jgi:hypothetical protein